MTTTFHRPRPGPGGLAPDGKLTVAGDVSRAGRRVRYISQNNASPWCGIHALFNRPRLSCGEISELEQAVADDSGSEDFSV